MSGVGYTRLLARLRKQRDQALTDARRVALPGNFVTGRSQDELLDVENMKAALASADTLCPAAADTIRAILVDRAEQASANVVLLGHLDRGE